MELISANTNYDILGKRRIWMTLSAILLSFAVYVWISKGEGKYGVDYKGGHEIVVRISEGGSSEKIREALTKHGIEEAIVQSYENEKGVYAIRIGSGGDEHAKENEVKAVQTKVSTILDETFPKNAEVVSTEYIGPTIGKELRIKALIATAVGCLGILIYLAVRFEFAFALGAVVAVFHDLVISTGIYLATGHAINGAYLAAALTILGYSVNDTIIIYDRIREELFSNKKLDMTLEQLMNHAINSTLSRTVITSFLTFLSTFALLIFGGATLSDLSLFLTVGIVVGTYSSIYIASPVVLWCESYKERRAAANQSKLPTAKEAMEKKAAAKKRDKNVDSSGARV